MMTIGTVFVLLAFASYLVDSLPRRASVTTTLLPTPFGCLYNGKHYAPGSSFGDGFDAASNWCYGAYCDETGHIIHWDNFHCHTTIPPPTTASPRTPTPRNGCFYNNKWYAPNTKIDEGYDASSNWCYMTLCDADGNILHGDHFNCKTTPPTTIPPTTIPTSIPQNPMVG